MRFAFLDSFRRRPDRAAALQSYQRLHDVYDDSCHWLDTIRAQAVGLLGLREGDTVLDVACGTGAMLPLLSERVGARGRVIGIEQSPEMAAIAANRAAGAPNVRVLVAPVEEARFEARADAVLFCYTHDVLQSDRAVENVMRHARPGARVVVAGARLRRYCPDLKIHATRILGTSYLAAGHAGVGSDL